MAAPRRAIVTEHGIIVPLGRFVRRDGLLDALDRALIAKLLPRMASGTVARPLRVAPASERHLAASLDADALLLSTLKLDFVLAAVDRAPEQETPLT
jgi:hypothetical protein